MSEDNPLELSSALWDPIVPSRCNLAYAAMVTRARTVNVADWAIFRLVSFISLNGIQICEGSPMEFSQLCKALLPYLGAILLMPPWWRARTVIFYVQWLEKWRRASCGPTAWEEASAHAINFACMYQRWNVTMMDQVVVRCDDFCSLLPNQSWKMDWGHLSLLWPIHWWCHNLLLTDNMTLFVDVVDLVHLLHIYAVCHT
jgi:hypothetical protein